MNKPNSKEERLMELAGGFNDYVVTKAGSVHGFDSIKDCLKKLLEDYLEPASEGGEDSP